MKYPYILVTLITSITLSNYCISVAQTDVFGITQMYTSKTGMIEWTSAHWNNGNPRTIKYSSDSYDPTNWTDDHSASGPGFYIDGQGMMTMSGAPRFHINPIINTKVPAQVFTNIEFTAYYRRKGVNGANWGGMIVGMRGSATGHGSSGGDDCKALCYMGRFRNDGKWDFEKELKHPATTYFSGSGYMHQDQLWKGQKLPENKWIGMKYILTNEDNNTTVRLRLYIDSISNGNPVNGGIWQFVGDIKDDGSNWQGADISGCAYTNKYMPILEGGNVFLRTDNDSAQYKMVSIREIDPTLPSINLYTKEVNKLNFYLTENNSKINIISNESVLQIDIISMSGQLLCSSKEAMGIDISSLARGTYMLRTVTNKEVISKKFVK